MLRELNGQAEVTQVNVPIIVDHNILGLDVSMYDLSHVAGFERKEHLHEHFVTLLFCEVSLGYGAHFTVEVSSRDVRQHHDDLLITDD